MSEAPKSLFEKFTDAVKEAVENPGKFITDTFNGFVDSLKNVIPTFTKPETVEQKQAEAAIPSKVQQSTKKDQPEVEHALTEEELAPIIPALNGITNNLNATQKTPIKPEHKQSPKVVRSKPNEPRPPHER